MKSMKKTILAFLAAIVVAGTFTACSSDDYETPEVSNHQNSELKFNISVADKAGFDGGATTRANASGWEAGDEILAFFDVDVPSTGTTAEKIAEIEDKLNKQKVRFTFDGTSWKAEPDADITLNASGTVRAVFSQGHKNLKLKDSEYNYKYIVDGDDNDLGGYTLYNNDMPYTYNTTTKVVTVNLDLAYLTNEVRIIVKGDKIDNNWIVGAGANDSGTLLSSLVATNWGFYFNYANIAYNAIMFKGRSYKNPIDLDDYSSFCESTTTTSPMEYYFEMSDTDATLAAGKPTVVRIANKDKSVAWEKTFSKSLKQNLSITITGPADPNATLAVGETDANGWKKIK